MIALKKDNKELRSKLKDLNNRLTDTLEKMRVKAVQAEKQREPTDPEEIHRRELVNIEDQIKLYQDEIKFLNQRNKEGSLIDTIKDLGLQVAQMSELEAKLKLELKGLNSSSAALGNKLKRLVENKDHISRVGQIYER